MTDNPSLEYLRDHNDIAYLYERAVKLREALKDVLDAAERDRAGFAIESEEWYALRDYARIQLEDSK